jgi:BirA family biotin operon repressor/biotin-[acetyl-CoA-carboxylase] ligase
MKILEFEKLESTQKKAKEIAKEAEPWTVVLAKEQTGGYGRKGNFWYSPRGGLYFSVILPNPHTKQIYGVGAKTKIEDLQILTILAAFCVAKILKEDFKLEPFIKLPNDVYVNNKKICGILTENIISGKEVKNSIIGIGLNTNIEDFPEELKEKATSLKRELKKEVEGRKILEKILKELKNYFLEIT